MVKFGNQKIIYHPRNQKIIYHSKGFDKSYPKMGFLLNLSHCVKSYGHLCQSLF